MSILNNNNNNDKDIKIMEDGTVLKKHDCNHIFVYNPNFNFDLTKYPERYSYLNEFFKILKGHSSISLPWAIQGYEGGLAYLDMTHV